MLEKLQQDISSCRYCEDKFGFEPHPIVWGNENSKIMHISQAPSLNVYKTLKPFNDASGEKLRKEWYRIPDDVFYNPDFFYIVSIAHCYPGKAPGGGDRQPPKICANRWLLKVIELVNNEIFLIVGGVAAKFFFPKQNFTSLVFNDNKINGKPAYVLPHPSPLNVKWFIDHPEFLQSRVKEIEKVVHEVLDLD